MTLRDAHSSSALDGLSVASRVLVSLGEAPDDPRLCVVLFAGSVHQLSCFTGSATQLWEPRALRPGVGPLCELWIEDGWAGIRARNADANDSELIVATVHVEGDGFVTEWEVPPVMPGWSASVALAEILLHPGPSCEPPERIDLPGGLSAAAYPPAWFASRLEVTHDMWWLPWWLCVTDEAGEFVGSCEYKQRVDGIVEFGVRMRDSLDEHEVWVHPDGRYWAARSWPPVEPPVAGRLEQPDEPEVTEFAVMLRALSCLSNEQWRAMCWPPDEVE